MRLPASAALIALAGLVRADTIRLPFECTPEDVELAGGNCTEQQPCPVLVELSAIESVGSRLFASGDFHTSGATLASLLLVSDDGGKSWTEAYPRQRGAAFDQIQFVDF